MSQGLQLQEENVAKVVGVTSSYQRVHVTVSEWVCSGSCDLFISWQQGLSDNI